MALVRGLSIDRTLSAKRLYATNQAINHICDISRCKEYQHYSTSMDNLEPSIFTVHEHHACQLLDPVSAFRAGSGYLVTPAVVASSIRFESYKSEK